VVAALFGRDVVFVLNALSFLASAMFIRGMSFEEPHAQAAAPLHARDALYFSPVVEGVRYVRKDRRLLAAVFARAGDLMIGPSWVWPCRPMWVACLWIVLAHCGGSTVWVFSTTLQQIYPEDRFRGRVFSADLGFSVLTIALGAYVCGVFLDWGVSREWWPRLPARAWLCLRSCGHGL
jgi:MFS family permease